MLPQNTKDNKIAKIEIEVTHVQHLSFSLQVYCFTETNSINCKSKIFTYTQIRESVYHSVLDIIGLNCESYQQSDKIFQCSI